MIFKDHEGLLIGARKGRPLAVGYGEHEAYLGSDAFALAPFTNRVAYLEDGDVAVVRGAAGFDLRRRGPPRQSRDQDHLSGAGAGGQGRPQSFHGQGNPRAAGSDRPHAGALSRSRRAGRCAAGQGRLREALAKASRLTISACGTAYYAGMVGKYWFEKLARLAVEIDVASELRYRDPVYPRGWRGAVRLAIGRDRRHAGGAARRQGQGPDHHRDRQCGGKLHRARSRHRAAHLCGAGDRRRLDQGLHLPAGGLAALRHRGGRRARRARRGRREAALRRAAGNAAPYRRIPEAGTKRSRRWARKSPRPATCSIWAAASAIRWRWKAR